MLNKPAMTQHTVIPAWEIGAASPSISRKTQIKDRSPLPVFLSHFLEQLTEEDR